MLTRLRHWARDTRGNVTVITSVSMMGALALTGAAIDYARAMSVKIALQSAVDATAIMLAQNLSTVAAGDLQTKANTFLQAAYYKASASEATVQIDTSKISQKLIGVRATSVMPTSLTQLIGVSSVTISATAQAISPESYRHRIAMVLDNSGSMDDKNKMKALQSASTRFLTALQEQASNAADIYVSIIPFNDTVNIDANASAWWIDWTDWNWNFDLNG